MSGNTIIKFRIPPEAVRELEARSKEEDESVHLTAQRLLLTLLASESPSIVVESNSKDTVAALQAVIVDLLALSAKDDRIKQLEDEVHSKDTEIANLQANLQAKEDEYDRLIKKNTYTKEQLWLKFKVWIKVKHYSDSYIKGVNNFLKYAVGK